MKKPAATLGLLQSRLSRSITALVLLTLIAATLTAFVIVRSIAIDDFRDDALAQSRFNLGVVAAIEEDGSTTSIAEINTELAQLGNFTIVASSTEISFSSAPGFSEVTAGGLLPTSAELLEKELRIDGKNYLVVASETADNIDYFFFYSRERLDNTLRTGAIVLTLTTLVAGLAAAWGAARIARRLLQPVHHVADATHKLALGQLDTRVPGGPRGKGAELVELNTSFNEMAATIETSIHTFEQRDEAQKRFVADVSHELRTPVTALTMAADLAEPGLTQLDGPPRRATEILIEESRHLRDLVEDLQEVARIDGAGFAPQFDDLDISDALRRCLDQRGYADQVEVAVTTADSSFLTDHRLLDRIVGNLVDNAFAHGALPVRVSVRDVPSTTSQQPHLEILVQDEGKGISTADSTRIFQRFAKLDAARTRGHGSGLGLAIARANANALGGDVMLEPTDSGTTFLVRLPRLNPVR